MNLSEWALEKTGKSSQSSQTDKPQVQSSTKTVVSLQGDPIVVARLRELGFIRGEIVTIAGRAPFGEPILVEIRGATVALRKSEAACVQV